MKCRMCRGIYLRSNGEINCYCSTGEQVSLAQLPLDHQNFDFVRDYYLKDQFVHLRESFANDKLPFPTHCSKCNYLEPFERFEEEKVMQEIEWIHMEAVSACNLKCPFCVHGATDPAKKWKRKPPYVLPRPLYTKIFNDIKNAGMKIKWIYFSGRGEPTLHPELWDMVGEVKDKFDTNFLINTAGNCKYSDKIIDSRLDKIKIAVDGIDAEEYLKYRINGNINRIFELTEKIANRKAQLNINYPEIIWQRVLFNFNDDYDSLIKYQEKAMEMGVNTIRVVLTWTENFSRVRPETFPRVFPNITFLDATGRTDISLDSLEHKLGTAREEGEIAHYMDILMNILHWSELSTEDRHSYDIYANTPITDQSIFKNRSKDPNLKAIKSIMGQAMADLADLYDKKGDTEEAKRFKNYYNRFNNVSESSFDNRGAAQQVHI